VEGVDSSEPRLLADGRTVLVPTFNCGLYRITGLEADSPSASLLYDFGGMTCAVPVVAGHYWIQTVAKPHANAVVALDISDLSKPVEAGRVTLGPRDWPHWLALEPDGKRLALTGYQDLQNQIVMINLGESGSLSIDQRFHNIQSGDEPGIRLDSKKWPHGDSGPAVPHGVVFSLPGNRSEISARGPASQERAACGALCLASER
jgi:hypothetical protein